MSGNENHGIIREATPNGTSGLEFHGKDSVEFGDKGFPVQDAPRSMLLWLKSSDTNNTKICAYYGRPEAGNSFYLIIFGHVHPNKQRWDRLSVGNAGGRDEPVGKTFIVDGKWHHAALVYDGRSTTRLYVDGNQDLVFNRRYSTTLPGQGFLGDSYKGVLDEIIIVNRALSQEEVKGVYEAQKLRFANTTFESINSLGTK